MTLAGLYRAVVVDNADPEARLRLRVRVPSVTGTEVVGWVWPCLPTLEGVRPPAPGQGVFVQYEAGDPDFPVWTGVTVAEPTGSVGPDSPFAYVHTQGIAASTWVITHNLGFYPNVTVIDSSGSEVEGDIVYTSSNVVTITFSAAFGGVAYLS